MSATESTMLQLGTTAPGFSLPDTVSGRTISLDEIKAGTATVVMFICNHCPYVKHLKPALTELATEYQQKGVSFVAISSNDVEGYPEDSPEQMKRDAEEFGYPFPYLYDESQEVAEAYHAVCTPEFYIFDGQLQLAYRGQFDDSRPRNDTPVSGHDVRAALDSLVAGEPVNPIQRPSIGCGIKWKA